MSSNSLSLDAILQHQQNEIDKNKDNYHQLDKNLGELSKDVKSILEKLDTLTENNLKFEVKLNKLEVIHAKREWWLKFTLTVLKRIAQMWWVWMLIVICFFAFDVELKVQNPELISIITNAIKNKI
jgi:galactose-1-phosphate uridylyltransferase